MAYDTTLISLVDQLRAELRQSLNPSAGVNVLDTQKRALRTAQEFLYKDHEWPFLSGEFDVNTAAGQQLYDLPVKKIKKVDFKWGTQWLPLKWGIGSPQLNSQDSDLDQRSDPVQRIDVLGAQFRVWPLPATGDNPIRFYGTQALRPLVKDDDRAMLDDLLIVSYAAWKLAPKERKKDALAEFTSIYATEKKATRRPAKHFVLGGGGGTPTGRQPPGHVRVAEADRSES